MKSGVTHDRPWIVPPPWSIWLQPLCPLLWLSERGVPARAPGLGDEGQTSWRLSSPLLPEHWRRENKFGKGSQWEGTRKGRGFLLILVTFLSSVASDNSGLTVGFALFHGNWASTSWAAFLPRTSLISSKVITMTLLTISDNIYWTLTLIRQRFRARHL